VTCHRAVDPGLEPRYHAGSGTKRGWGVYGKIFESIYDGTLAADWRAMITFQQMIILADADGVVDYTPAALSRRTGIPLEIIEHGIKKLEEPDPYSRTNYLDGRRIIRLDEHRPWSWEIVNYDVYRKKASREEQREKARLRKQKQRARERQPSDSEGSHADVTDEAGQSRMSHHTDEMRSDTDNNNNKATKVPFQAIVDLYHEHCPDLPRVKVISPKRKAQLRSRWKTFEVMRGVGKPGESMELIRFDDLESWERYFKFITEKCPFMSGKNERAWVANFDFCIRESAMVNVMENKYVERK